jgi:hypothetical protein
MGHASFVLSRDGQSQIAVVLSDDLHRLVWGRLHYGNRPFDVPTVEVDARTWIAAERIKPPVARSVDWTSPYADSSTLFEREAPQTSSNDNLTVGEAA